MRPLAFSWPYWIVFWAVYAWAFLPEFRIMKGSGGGARRPNSPDAGSLRVIAAAQLAGLVLAFTFAFLHGARLPEALQPFCFWLGLVMIFSGSLLRRHCWKLLGGYFTGDVQVKPGQVVIDRGAYAWVRHPSYSAGMLMLIGISIALGTWAGILAVSAATFLSYHYRMTIEERALEAALGEPYRVFMKTRKRLFPFIY